MRFDFTQYCSMIIGVNVSMTIIKTGDFILIKPVSS